MLEPMMTQDEVAMREMIDDLRALLRKIGNRNLTLNATEERVIRIAWNWAWQNRVPYTQGNVESVRYFHGRILELWRVLNLN
jgi:hypothetical protein